MAPEKQSVKQSVTEAPEPQQATAALKQQSKEDGMSSTEFSGEVARQAAATLLHSKPPKARNLICC